MLEGGAEVHSRTFPKQVCQIIGFLFKKNGDLLSLLGFPFLLTIYTYT